MADIKRNLEQGGGLYLNKWWSGLFTNRSPLFTPISAMGLQFIERQDTLIGGQNVSCSPQLTLKRRFGHSKACSVAFSTSEWPLTYSSFQDISGAITPIVDTQTNVYSFTPSSKTAVYTKAGGAVQSSFVDVISTLYWVDGKNAKKLINGVVTNIGIVPPGYLGGGGSGNHLLAENTGSGSLTTLIGWQYVIAYRNANTDHISTTSFDQPRGGGIAATGAFSSAASVSIGSIHVSSDPQVTNVDIYRTKDGGSVYYYLDTITNGTTTYSDTISDSGLNTNIIGPVAHVNDPPPFNLSLLCWYAGRLWGAVGNTLYYSAGPDCINGVGEEAWPPGNNYTLPGNITALISTSQGLIICLKDDAYVTTGSTAATFTVPQLWQQNFGVAGQNSVTQDGDYIYFFTSRNQVWEYSNSGGINEIGFNIRDKLASFTPANVYITIHRSGQDEGVFISDGTANIYRYSTVNQGWDAVAQPVGGCGAIASIETSTAVWTLLMGRATGSGYILQRDLTTYQDDGTSYGANAIVGSLTLAPPRQVANIASVLFQGPVVGTYPTISVLLNEITDTGTFPATFTVLPNPVPDPPQLPPSQTLWMKRHDFKAAQSPLSGHVQNMQIKVDFGTQNAASELYGLGLA